MKLAVMQPYFFPYLGYFSLIESTDHFVFFDTPQYSKNGWTNRNRILHPKNGHNYITIPINKLPLNTPINKITIYQNNWKSKILGQLESIYKKSAPYYVNTMELVRECLLNDYTHLAPVNIGTVLKTCEFMDLPIDYSIFSQMNLEIDSVHESDEWALNITRAMGFDIYCNSPGGQALYDGHKYLSENICLEFIKNRLSAYEQKGKEFIPGLSIVDVLMWNSPKEALALIKDYDIISGADNADS